VCVCVFENIIQTSILVTQTNITGYSYFIRCETRAGFASFCLIVYIFVVCWFGPEWGWVRSLLFVS